VLVSHPPALIAANCVPKAAILALALFNSPFNVQLMPSYSSAVPTSLAPSL